MTDKLTIDRYLMDENQGTFGLLFWNDEFIGHTVEQPWRDNQSFISCIPAGEYQCLRHVSNKYGVTYAFHNPDLHVQQFRAPNDDTVRYACLIHAANRAAQLQGCIAPGLWAGMIAGDKAVTNSSAAMLALRAIWGDRESFDAEIINRF